MHRLFLGLLGSKGKTKKAQLSLGQATVLVVSDLKGHTGSMIFISSKKAYATSYW